MDWTRPLSPRPTAGVLGLEPRLTGPEPVGLPITPYPIGRGPSEPPDEDTGVATIRPKPHPGTPSRRHPARLSGGSRGPGRPSRRRLFGWRSRRGPGRTPDPAQ